MTFENGGNRAVVTVTKPSKIVRIDAVVTLTGGGLCGSVPPIHALG
jgi:hypothetical protein